MSFMNRRVPSGKSKLFRFKSFKSFLTLITCSQSFLLKFHYHPIAFFCCGGSTIWVLLTNISLNLLQNFAHSFLKGAMYNSVRHAYYICTLPSGVQRVCPTLTSKGSFLFHQGIVHFLQTWTSDSSLLKLAFQFLIPFAAIQNTSDLYELNFDIFEQNFWYKVQFCALLAEFFFINWSHISSFRYGTFIEKQKNGIHQHKINE